MASASISAPAIARNMTLRVRVTGAGRMALRWWATGHLLRLAAAVSGMRMEVATD